MITTATAPCAEEEALLDSQEPVQVLYYNAALSERFILPFAQHNVFVLRWFKQGSGVFTIDFKTQEIKPGRLFFTQPNAIHAIDTQQSSVLEEWVLVISLDYLHDYGSNLIDLLLSQHRIFSLDIPENHQHKLEQLFELLHSELKGEAAWKDSTVNAYLAILLTEFKRLCADTTPQLMHLDARYEEFLLLVQEDYKKHLDIEAYASKVSLSSKQLNRICKDITGLTARQIIDDRLMLEARRMLHHTDLSVKEIAYELGFEEPSHFIKFFHRFSEPTPLQYRQQMTLNYHTHYNIPQLV